MTGQAATRRRPGTRLLLVPVAALTGLLMAFPALQPAVVSPVRAASSLRAERAGSPAAAQAAIGGEIQNFILNFAAGKLAGFAFNKLGLDKLLGDNTGQQLSELKAQLEKISAQVMVLQDSLNQISTDLAKLAVEGYTRPLGQTVSKIKSLYKDFYVPALNALTLYVTEDLAATRSKIFCVDDPPCKAALDHYESLRGDFLRQFTAEGPASYNIQIHDTLLPGVIRDSAISAYGLYLAKSGTGFLTSSDSDALLNFYNYFADYEALAAWMKAQWNSERFSSKPAEFENFLNEQIYGYQDKEHKALPPRVPADIVIVLPTNAALRTNTKNLPMWETDPFPPLWATSWNPHQDAFPWAAVGVPRLIYRLNTTAAGYGYHDWKVPSRAELDALLSRGPADQTAGGFLPSLNASPRWQEPLKSAFARGPYIWTTQGAGIPSWAGSPEIYCLASVNGVWVRKATFTDYLHTAVGPVTNSLRGYPAQYGNYNRPSLGIKDNNLYSSGAGDPILSCKDKLKSEIDKAFGPTGDERLLLAVLLATRNTGDVNYLP